MLPMAAGLAMVPTVGSQGAGAFGEHLSHADANLLGSSQVAANALASADRLVSQQVLKQRR